MMLSLIRLMRLYYGVPLTGGLVVILYYLTAGELSAVIGKVAFSCISLLTVISAGYVFNDVCDIEVDKINCPQRMLAAEKLKRKTAIIWSCILLLAGLIFGSFCGLAFFVTITAIAALLVFYDIRSKRIGIFKDFLVAVLMTSLYPLAFSLTESTQTPRLNVLYIHPVWLFLSSFGYEMLKDIRDVKGDCLMNGEKSSYCMDKKFLITSRILVVVASIITLLPHVLGYCKEVYLAVSIIAILLAIASTFNKPTVAICYIYVEIFLITGGAMADSLVYGF